MSNINYKEPPKKINIDKEIKEIKISKKKIFVLLI